MQHILNDPKGINIALSTTCGRWYSRGMTAKSLRIHDRIRHVLETTPGLTQRGLAEHMGLNPAAVNRMLYGRRNIMAEEIAIIENYIGQKLDLNTGVVAEPRARGVSDIPQQAGLAAPFAAAPGSFTVYVFADDMAPRYFKGELVQVQPRQPAEEGRDCLIEKKNGSVLIRRLLKIHDDRLRVQQFHPPAEKDIPRRDIKAVYPIIGRN